MEHWFSAGGRFGTAKLIRKNRKYYLHIPVTLEAENRNILNHIVGIDLGVNHLAVSFDDEGNTRFFSGRTVTEHVRLKSRYVMVSWAFCQFREMLEYKAALSQSEVLATDPKYTSQSCPVCGNTTKANRNRRKHEFCCTVCGYRSNDDRTGAINIYRKGCNTLFAEACQA